MVSSFAILSNISLASVVLAILPSSSRLEGRLARRRENHQSKPINRIDAPDGATSNARYSSNWAGAVWGEGEGSFVSVTGNFTVPTPTGSDGSASAWVGIDGYSCKNAILQTGIDFTISNGEVSYDAWYEWYPDYAYDIDGFTMSAGDEIGVTVSTSSTTSGTAVIENLTSGQWVIQEISSPYSLCQQDAEWIVEDYQEGGSLVPFVDFGTVMFTGATATDYWGNSYIPQGATIVNLKQDYVVLTSVSTSMDTVTVNYV